MHGDLALEARVDFLAVVEHRCILARVRGEYSGLKSKGLASVWAPASQDSSHFEMQALGLLAWEVLRLFCLLLLLLNFEGFWTVSVLFVACFLSVVVGLCTWWYCMVFGVLILMRSSSL